MPTPHLHPRSRMTSSLFATTVFASFFVVALPHLLPCPAPRVSFADGQMPEGGNQRRRRKPEAIQGKDGVVDFSSSIASDEFRKPKVEKRECPVPKPGGMVGEILGFKKPTAEDEQQRPAR